GRPQRRSPRDPPGLLHRPDATAFPRSLRVKRAPRRRTSRAPGYRTVSGTLGVAAARMRTPGGVLPGARIDQRPAHWSTLRPLGPPRPHHSTDWIALSIWVRGSTPAPTTLLPPGPSTMIVGVALIPRACVSRWTLASSASHLELLRSRFHFAISGTPAPL